VSATRAKVRREHGTATLWVLGLCIALMFLGGLSLDFWRALAVRRDLSARADAAAMAGANGLDEERLRAGVLVLDPLRARALAGQELVGATLDDAQIRVESDSVVVILRDHVDFSLLGIFMPGEKFVVEVDASAGPEERP
jgi:hypothetical protein